MKIIKNPLFWSGTNYRVSSASLVAKKFSNSREDQKSFAKLIAFLKDHPEYFGWRGKKMPNLNSENGVAIVAEKYFSKRHEKTVPSIPTTVPDPMVSLIMVHFCGYSETKAERSAKSLMFRYLIDTWLCRHSDDCGL